MPMNSTYPNPNWTKCYAAMREARKTKSRGPRQKPLNNIRPRRAKQRQEYKERHALFLAAHPYCEVAQSGVLGEPTTRRATQVHHKLGCTGDDLNDERFWMAVSMEGHAWIERYRLKSRMKGWLLTRDAKAQKHQGIK